MANIEALLAKCKQQTNGEKEYLEAVPKLFADNSSITVNEDSDPMTISYDVPVNDTQKLHVCLAVAYPDAENDALFHIVSWHTQNVDIWDGEENAPLLDGDGIGFMDFDSL